MGQIDSKLGSKIDLRVILDGARVITVWCISLQRDGGLSTSIDTMLLLSCISGTSMCLGALISLRSCDFISQTTLHFHGPHSLAYNKATECPKGVY